MSSVVSTHAAAVGRSPDVAWKAQAQASEPKASLNMETVNYPYPLRMGQVQFEGESAYWHKGGETEKGSHHLSRVVHLEQVGLRLHHSAK